MRNIPTRFHQQGRVAPKALLWMDLLTMHNYRALKHLMWRGHHFPDRSRSRDRIVYENVRSGPLFELLKWRYQSGKGKLWVQKRVQNGGDERRTDAGQTHMDF